MKIDINCEHLETLGATEPEKEILETIGFVFDRVSEDVDGKKYSKRWHSKQFYVHFDIKNFDEVCELEKKLECYGTSMDVSITLDCVKLFSVTYRLSEFVDICRELRNI